MEQIKYIVLFIILSMQVKGQPAPIAYAWANNSVNAVIFRKNSVVSYKDMQYVAYYDTLGYVMLAKRKLNTHNWETKQTPYLGKISDAHCSISIMVDGEGYLHLSWGHHNDSLNYCKSVAPGSLQLTQELSMVDKNEDDVTYPEFFRLSNGDLLFMYRFGISGRGNLVINKYSVFEQKWVRLYDVLIDGENLRNAYWQSCVDVNGTIHISWVWRDTWDVSSNHDMCYAKSDDGGLTWKKSTGENYILPITAANAEYVAHIPQNSELINQTSMCADSKGRPYIATYWTPKGTLVPQYHAIFLSDTGWQTKQLTKRTKGFSLSGGGTKKIPISRPQIVVNDSAGSIKIMLIYRDSERDSKVSINVSECLANNTWNVYDITDFSVESWEPSYDTELWKANHQLHIYVQKVGQGDGEGLQAMPAQPVYIYEFYDNIKPTEKVVVSQP